LLIYTAPVPLIRIGRPEKYEGPFVLKKEDRILKSALVQTTVLLILLSSVAHAQTKPRARDLGVPFDGTTGRFNAFTDVKGVEVGHTTLTSGSGKNLVFGVNEAFVAGRVGVVCRKKQSDCFARAKLWRLGSNEGSTRREVSRHPGITATGLR
jgi:hypothetical protein